MRTDSQMKKDILKILDGFEVCFRDADCKWFDGIDRRDFDALVNRILEVIKKGGQK